jgi:ankyrin repeat protein
MAAAGVVFHYRDETAMRRWAEEHPGSVYEQDRVGHTLLIAAAYRNMSMDFITWLVDEKGADIDSRGIRGRTALFYANSIDVLSFLLDRGANPTLQDNRDGHP